MIGTAGYRLQAIQNGKDKNGTVQPDFNFEVPRSKIFKLHTASSLTFAALLKRQRLKNQDTRAKDFQTRRERILLKSLSVVNNDEASIIENYNVNPEFVDQNKVALEAEKLAILRRQQITARHVKLFKRLVVLIAFNCISIWFIIRHFTQSFEKNVFSSGYSHTKNSTFEESFDMCLIDRQSRSSVIEDDATIDQCCLDTILQTNLLVSFLPSVLLIILQLCLSVLLIRNVTSIVQEVLAEKHSDLIAWHKESLRKERQEHFKIKFYDKFIAPKFKKKKEAATTRKSKLTRSSALPPSSVRSSYLSKNSMSKFSRAVSFAPEIEVQEYNNNTWKVPIYQVGPAISDRIKLVNLKQKIDDEKLPENFHNRDEILKELDFKHQKIYRNYTLYKTVTFLGNLKTMFVRLYHKCKSRLSIFGETDEMDNPQITDYNPDDHKAHTIHRWTRMVKSFRESSSHCDEDLYNHLCG